MLFRSKDHPGDVEGEPPRKRVPAKVMWYPPIIPRLMRLFRNKDNAKLMRWHKEELLLLWGDEGVHMWDEYK